MVVDSSDNLNQDLDSLIKNERKNKRLTKQKSSIIDSSAYKKIIYKASKSELDTKAEQNDDYWYSSDLVYKPKTFSDSRNAKKNSDNETKNLHSRYESKLSKSKINRKIKEKTDIELSTNTVLISKMDKQNTTAATNSDLLVENCFYCFHFDDLDFLSIRVDSSYSNSITTIYMLKEIIEFNYFLKHCNERVNCVLKRFASIVRARFVENDLDEWVAGKHREFNRELLLHYLDVSPDSKSIMCNNKYPYLYKTLLRCLQPDGLMLRFANTKSVSKNENSQIMSRLQTELNADVINIYISLLKEHYESKEVYVFETDYMNQFDIAFQAKPNQEEQVLSDNIVLPSNMSSWKSEIKRIMASLKVREKCIEVFERLHKYLQRANVNLDDYSLLCFPYNYFSVHWILLVADVKNKKVYWLDSTQSQYSAGVRKLLSNSEYGLRFSLSAAEQDIALRPGFAVIEYLVKFILYYKSKREKDFDYELTAWKKIVVSDLPQQNAGSLDCGVFMCQYIRCVLKYLDPTKFDFVAEDISKIKEGMILSLGAGKIFTSLDELNSHKPEVMNDSNYSSNDDSDNLVDEEVIAD